MKGILFASRVVTANVSLIFEKPAFVRSILCTANSGAPNLNFLINGIDPLVNLNTAWRHEIRVGLVGGPVLVPLELGGVKSITVNMTPGPIAAVTVFYSCS